MAWGYFDTIVPSLVTILILIVMACCIYGCCVWEGNTDVEMPDRQHSNQSKKYSNNNSTSDFVTAPSYTDSFSENNADIFTAMEQFNCSAGKGDNSKFND